MRPRREVAAATAATVAQLAELSKLLQFLSPGMEIYKGLQIIEQQFSIFATNCQGRELLKSWGIMIATGGGASRGKAANLN